MKNKILNYLLKRLFVSSTSGFLGLWMAAHKNIPQFDIYLYLSAEVCNLSLLNLIQSFNFFQSMYRKMSMI